MKTKYNHISEWERKAIERMVQAGNSNKEIAWRLGRSVSTIGWELKRNYIYGARSYDSERAQKLAEQRRQDSKEPQISEKIWEEVFRLYNEDWSPEQISGALKLQDICVSHETIYRRIYAESEVASWIKNTCGRGAKNDDVGRQSVCLEILRNFRSKIARISVPERNSAIGKATPLSSFAAKVISSQWSNATRDFYWLRTSLTRNPTPSETPFYQCSGTFRRP